MAGWLEQKVAVVLNGKELTRMCMARKNVRFMNTQVTTVTEITDIKKAISSATLSVRLYRCTHCLLHICSYK